MRSSTTARGRWITRCWLRDGNDVAAAGVLQLPLSTSLPGYGHRSGVQREAMPIATSFGLRLNLLPSVCVRKKRELVGDLRSAKAMELLIATVQVALAGMAARIAGNDMQERRQIDQTIFETRVKLANQFNAFADQAAL